MCIPSDADRTYLHRVLKHTNTWPIKQTVITAGGWRGGETESTSWLQALSQSDQVSMYRPTDTVRGGGEAGLVLAQVYRNADHCKTHWWASNWEHLLTLSGDSPASRMPWARMAPNLAMTSSCLSLITLEYSCLNWFTCRHRIKECQSNHAVQRVLKWWDQPRFTSG